MHLLIFAYYHLWANQFIMVDVAAVCFLWLSSHYSLSHLMTISTEEMDFSDDEEKEIDSVVVTVTQRSLSIQTDFNMQDLSNIEFDNRNCIDPKAIYSASAIDNATVACFWLNQLIAPPDIVNTLPVAECLLSKSFAQSASQLFTSRFVL